MFSKNIIYKIISIVLMISGAIVISAGISFLGGIMIGVGIVLPGLFNSKKKVIEDSDY